MEHPPTSLKDRPSHPAVLISANLLQPRSMKPIPHRSTFSYRQVQLDYLRVRLQSSWCPRNQCLNHLLSEGLDWLRAGSRYRQSERDPQQPMHQWHVRWDLDTGWSHRSCAACQYVLGLSGSSVGGATKIRTARKQSLADIFIIRIILVSS